MRMKLSMREAWEGLSITFNHDTPRASIHPRIQSSLSPQSNPTIPRSTQIATCTSQVKNRKKGGGGEG